MNNQLQPHIDEEHAYQEALAYLNEFTNFETISLTEGNQPDLTVNRPTALLNLLGNPHNQFKSIHIAGTKGKGSVAAMCAYSLRTAGLRVGLYTSPHLRDFRERIRILSPNDPLGWISKQDLITHVTRIRDVAHHVPGITWFEVVTTLAFCHFANQKIDIAVIEVGLGGRLDATNVITPLVSIITHLGLDHTDLLGNTLNKIAWEKGGIIKQSVPVVCAPQKPDALTQLKVIAKNKNAPLHIVVNDQSRMHYTSLKGVHQQENALVATAALHLIQPYFPTLTISSIQIGLATVEWPGRLQTIETAADQPTILLDCAHNPDSIAALLAYLHTVSYNRLWIVFGASADKDVYNMLQQLLPHAHETHVVQSPHPRAVTTSQLQTMATEISQNVVAQPDIASAVHAIFSQATPNDLICITGSVFVVGDFLDQWENLAAML